MTGRVSGNKTLLISLPVSIFPIGYKVEMYEIPSVQKGSVTASETI